MICNVGLSNPHFLKLGRFVDKLGHIPIISYFTPQAAQMAYKNSPILSKNKSGYRSKYHGSLINMSDKC